MFTVPKRIQNKIKLQNHAKICTGNNTVINCESCGKIVKTKKEHKSNTKVNAILKRNISNPNVVVNLSYVNIF